MSPPASTTRAKAGDLLVRLDDDDALTKVAGANAEAQVRVRERNEEDARGLQLERRNAEDAVASAERAVFGAQQAFDDALDKKRNNNGSDDDCRQGAHQAHRRQQEARRSSAPISLP